MTDQLWFAVTLDLGLLLPEPIHVGRDALLWWSSLRLDKPVDFVNVMIVAMDEGQPGLSGLQKKERGLLLLRRICLE